MEKHFAASAIIFKDKQVLMLEHKKYDIWLYPGGHVEKGENPVRAVIREVKEETGYSVRILERKQGLITEEQSFPLPYVILLEEIPKNTIYYHQHIDLVFLCEILPEEDPVASSENQHLEWVPLDKISSLKTLPEIPYLLEQAHLKLKSFSPSSFASGAEEINGYAVKLLDLDSNQNYYSPLIENKDPWETALELRKSLSPELRWYNYRLVLDNKFSSVRELPVPDLLLENENKEIEFVYKLLR